MLLHPLALFCDHCNADVQAHTISFRADGMFALEGKCPNGHGVTQMVIAMEELISHCHKADVRAIEIAKIMPVPRKRRN